MKLIDCCSAIGETLPTRKMLSWILPRRGSGHGVTNQTIVLAMKLSFFLLTAAFLQVGARGVAQNTVTYSGKKVSLQTVFKAIEKQTGYSFFYNDKVVEKSTPVSIKLAATPLEEALDILLRDQPLSFSISGKTIFIKEKVETSKGDHSTSNAGVEPPPVDVKGRVMNENGEPVLASVMVKGSNVGTTTNADGYFELKGVDDNAVLVITASNIETREIGLKGRSDLSVVNVKMKVSPLDEMQVIAYGTRSKRLQTGNISTIKGREIENQPVDNPLLALQGRVPGLSISQATGLPGSGIQILIQGQNSILNGNDPFYVIDGVPFVSQLLPNYGVMLGRTQSAGLTGEMSNGNPLSFINPQDIESIEILKDADATAIYGSRAANGAILITTKKGKQGKTTVNLKLQNGWGHIARKLSMITPEQYIQMRKDAYSSDGLTVPTPNIPDINKTPLNYDLTLWNNNNVTDWQDALIGNSAKYNDILASMTGGSGNTQFILSAGYHRETTVFPNNFDDKKGSVHLNFNNVSENQRLRLQFSANYVADQNMLPNHDLTFEALYLSPFAPSLYTSDGTLNWMPNSAGVSTWQNPVSYTYEKYKNNTSNLVSNATVSYRIMKSIEIKSSFGYNDLTSREIQTFPLTAKKPETRQFENRIGQYGNNQINTWIVEPQIRYESSLFNKSSLELLIGSTFQQTNKNGLLQYGYGFNSDLLIEDIMSAPYVGINSTISSQYNYNAFFGRVNWNWDNKYILNFTGRKDGSSRFGTANRFHSFGAVGTSWIFSKENLFSKSRLLSFGKIRASYGSTGNDQIPDYKFLSLYNSVPVEIPYQSTTGLEVSNLSNPYLEWEETKKLNVGIDLGFIRDKILLNFNYYRNRSSNQLVGYPLPSVTGFSSIDANLPAVIQSSGIEMIINTTNVATKDFTWTTSFNFTIPRNKLIAFPDLENSSYSFNYEIGEPVYRLKVYKFHGVNPTTGLFEFETKNGNITSTPSTDDRIVSIETTPKYYGGFQNGLHYKSFQLDFLFQFVKQIGNNYVFGRRPGRFAGGYGNQPTYVLDHWQKTGDLAPNQRYSSNSYGTIFSTVLNSDASYSDASYIRLKNVSLSWNLPNRWMRKILAQKAILFVNAQNLLTYTDYKGLDPETRNTISLPPLRVITAGIDIQF